MFYPLPDSPDIPPHSLHKGKKHKKSKNRYRRFAKRQYDKDSRFSSVMSSWAENFTVAATWQLKHQLAYWKARAISLEYENRALHEVIRRNNLVMPSASSSEIERETDVYQNIPTEYSTKNRESEGYEENDMDYNENEAECDVNEGEGEDFEVSEEFIQFLTANAKYKEDARREKERLKAKLEEETIEDIQESRESLEEKIKRKKHLYGDKWQTIIALEMSLMSDFINESDKHKPMYWPNIPFNFRSS